MSRTCVNCGSRIIKSVFIQNLGFDGEVFRVVLAAGICFVLLGIFFSWGIAAFGASLMITGTLFLLIRSL